MSARESYPRLQWMEQFDAVDGAECRAALDEIDRLRQSVDELMAQIVAMQTADPNAIRTVIAGYWGEPDPCT